MNDFIPKQNLHEDHCSTPSDSQNAILPGKTRPGVIVQLTTHTKVPFTTIFQQMYSQLKTQKPESASAPQNETKQKQA